jgi:hypothetical protein
MTLRLALWAGVALLLAGGLYLWHRYGLLVALSEFVAYCF